LIVAVFLGCREDKNLGKGNSPKNRLSEANSPYLVQHADNPVDWYEWGPEAMEKAEKEGKPIIISVGYAACHWCHVMEKESFMDPEVAEIMNREFVSIKIDREERPDIDKIYMNAAQLLNGSGGWPLNVVALPNGKPFFAGTYFTTDEWKNILNQIAIAYKDDKARINRIAEDLTEGIRKVNSLDSLVQRNSNYSESDYRSVYKDWQNKFDTEKGGYKDTQKFPLPVTWNALLQYYYLTGEEDALKDVTTTLNKMARGGIYDQIGGGFARYTTDTRWLIPHFEKMLYDNAQLVSLYSNAYKITKNEEYREVIEQTLAFVERELANGEGGYYSSVNADSEGEEGKYYVWTVDEFKKTLSSSEAALISKYYNIKPHGNWEEGKNILYRNSSSEEFAKKNNIPKAQFEETIKNARKKLLTQREKRIRPTIDDKSLTAWNALMVDAYLDAFLALGKDDYLEKAVNTAEFLDKKMLKPDFSLWRSHRDGKTGVQAFLDDYSLLSRSYLNLYQVTFDVKWLEKARKITDYSIRNFGNSGSSMFYYTTGSDKSVVARNLELDDNVIPSSNSVMAHNLFILGTLQENKEYLELSDTMLSQMAAKSLKEPSFYANWVQLFGLRAFGAFEIAIMGEKAAEKNYVMQKHYLPTAVFMGGAKENLPLLEGKLTKDETLIYVCQNKTCKYPVSNVEEAVEILNDYLFGEGNGNQNWSAFGKN
jgi:uncharacterized protein YyaL (SSP411 family)